MRLTTGMALFNEKTMLYRLAEDPFFHALCFSQTLVSSSVTRKNRQMSIKVAQKRFH